MEEIPWDFRRIFTRGKVPGMHESRAPGSISRASLVTNYASLELLVAARRNMVALAGAAIQSDDFDASTGMTLVLLSYYS